MIETSTETKITFSNLFSRIKQLESQIRLICDSIINEKGDNAKNYTFDTDFNLIEVETKEKENAN